jgi:hypothetical protein
MSNSAHSQFPTPCILLPLRSNPKGTMNRKVNDWIEHATLGLGCVSEDRGDRLDI